MLGPRRSMVATAQDTPTQVEQYSLPLRILTSWDEAHAKHAEIAENSTVEVCVINTIGTDVEEGKVTIKVHRDEDKSRYMSGPKLVFLFLCVYRISTAQNCCFYPTIRGLLLSMFLGTLGPPWVDPFKCTLTYNSGTRPEHRCDSFTSNSKLFQLSGLCNMDRIRTLLDSKCQTPLQAPLGHSCHLFNSSKLAHYYRLVKCSPLCQQNGFISP